MKNLAWMVGFALGVLVAVGCDEDDGEAPEDEGVMFACGDDMCLSSEEACLSNPQCIPGQTLDENPHCAPLDETMAADCQGEPSEGLHCVPWCG